MKDKELDYSKKKTIPCPDCYGGHFRPCNWCCDTGIVEWIPYKPAPKPDTMESEL